MDGFPQTRSLLKEVSETFLLLTVAALTLGGYLGLALFFVGAIK
jgi:hypothetical protein